MTCLPLYFHYFFLLLSNNHTIIKSEVIYEEIINNLIMQNKNQNGGECVCVFWGSDGGYKQQLKPFYLKNVVTWHWIDGELDVPPW